MRITVLICLLTLQLQVYAAEALACKHAGDFAGETATDRLAAACPHAGAGQQTALADADGAPVKCQKCALELCVFSGLGVFGQPPNLVSLQPAPPTPAVQRHYYAFSPDPGKKPPIAFSG
jgi:hypothetical protein